MKSVQLPTGLLLLIFTQWKRVGLWVGVAGLSMSITVWAAAPVVPRTVENNLRQRVEFGYVTGVVVGMVNADGRSFFSAGRVDARRDTTPTPDTLFEVGSITKAFTGTLLAEMIQRGEVALETTVQSLLPDTVTVPRGGSDITLRDLAVHRSGLPDNPDNLCSTSLHDLFNCYSTARLYEFLSGYTLEREPDAAWAYSNLGLGLLGHALARRASRDYEALLKERLLDPLGLNDTRIVLSAEQQTRKAGGHFGDVTWPDFAIPGMEGAGALLSTANDLLTFLEHVSGLKTNVLGAVATEATRRRAEASSPNVSMALGWILVSLPGGEVVQHDGATYGQNAFIGFHRASRRGVVVLCNNRVSTYGAAQDVGFHLLDSNYPLTSPRRPSNVPPETLAAYEGRYVSPEGVAFDAEIVRGRVTLNFSGDRSPGFTVHAESGSRFGAYEVGLNATALFNLNETPPTLTWTQNGVASRFTRTAVPARLELARSNGGIQLTLRGTPDVQYQIEHSSDLRAWEQSELRRPTDSGFAAPGGSSGQSKFYRATLPSLE